MLSPAEQAKADQELYAAIVGAGGEDLPTPSNAEEHIQQVRKALLKGANVNYVYTNFHNYTPLQVAIFHEHVDIALYLLHYPGVNLNYRAENGDNRDIAELTQYKFEQMLQHWYDSLIVMYKPHLEQVKASNRMPVDIHNNPSTNLYRVKRALQICRSNPIINIGQESDIPENWELPRPNLRSPKVDNTAVRRAVNKEFHRLTHAHQRHFDEIKQYYLDAKQRLVADESLAKQRVVNAQKALTDDWPLTEARIGIDVLRRALLAAPWRLEPINIIWSMASKDVMLWNAYINSCPLSKAIIEQDNETVMFLLNFVGDYAVGNLDKNTDYDLALNICFGLRNSKK